MVLATAAQLVCRRVATGLADEKLAEAAARIVSAGAHHCVVLHEENKRFLGLIRLADIAGRTDPGRRILGDLVSGPTPVSVHADESAVKVAERFEAQALGEAVVVDDHGGFLGLITAESVLEWSLGEHRRVELRMREDEEILRATQAQLQAALTSKDEFLAMLSHELRTPLNPILLIASEAARDDSLPEETRSDFATIEDNTLLEARLIDDLLDLTRLSRGKLSVRLELVPLHAVLKEALEKLKPQLAAGRFAVELAWSEGDPVVSGDPLRLQQVFWNILQNAVKFTPSGGSIGLKTQVKRGTREVEVIFTDSGLGMSPEELACVFQPFQQGDHATDAARRRYGGLGLGMTIAKSLVELHHGRITAESEGRDCGSRFTLVFPLAEMEPVSSMNDSAPAPLAAMAPAQLVLLVEDYEPSRQALATFLRRRKFRYVETSSYAGALELAGQHPFSFVISDLGLPDGDGHDLMAKLRDRHGLGGIAISGYGSPADLAKSKAAGFAVHLVKPVRIAELEAALALVPVKT